MGNNVSIKTSPVTGSGGGGGGLSEVEGVNIDNSPITSNQPVLTGGKAVDPTTYTPAYTVDDAVTAAYDKDTGAMLVLQGDLNKSKDSVTSYTQIDTTNGFTRYFRDTSDASALNGLSVTIKGSAGSIGYIEVVNAVNTNGYLRLYNKTNAISADTPIWTVPVAPGVGQFNYVFFPQGLSFDTALSIRYTTVLASADATAPATNPTIHIHYL